MCSALCGRVSCLMSGCVGARQEYERARQAPEFIMSLDYGAICAAACIYDHLRCALYDMIRA